MNDESFSAHQQPDADSEPIEPRRVLTWTRGFLLSLAALLPLTTIVTLIGMWADKEKAVEIEMIRRQHLAVENEKRKEAAAQKGNQFLKDWYDNNQKRGE